mmetsp:Transcript_567/g.1059  ORF Transcript_567/g.1059 Transcript_567/m.1059 type:complete len:200 (-) Transcript_567:2294-2893(-)
MPGLLTRLADHHPMAVVRQSREVLEGEESGDVARHRKRGAAAEDGVDRHSPGLIPVDKAHVQFGALGQEQHVVAGLLHIRVVKVEAVSTPGDHTLRLQVGQVHLQFVQLPLQVLSGGSCPLEQHLKNATALVGSSFFLALLIFPFAGSGVVDIDLGSAPTEQFVAGKPAAAGIKVQAGFVVGALKDLCLVGHTFAMCEV